MFTKDGLIKLEDFFLEKYHYQYSNTIDLMKMPFIEYEGVGATAIFWIKDDDDKYLFKEVKEDSYVWLGEIISYEVAKILEIPCAEYRLATLNGKIGVLSKNFIKTDETLILGGQIIQEVLNRYPYLKGKNVFEDREFLELYNVPQNIMNLNFENRNKYLHNNLNNLEEIWSLLSLYFDLHHVSEDSLPLIMNQLLKICLFDILTFQADRHITNWGILKIKREDGISLLPAPLFDSAASFGLASKRLNSNIENFYQSLESYQRTGHEKSKQQFVNVLYKDRILLSFSEDAIKNAKERRRKNNLESLNYFLEVSSQDDVEILINYIEALEKIGIGTIMNYIEEYYQIKIDEKISKYIQDSFCWNLLFLKSNIYQKRR